MPPRALAVTLPVALAAWLAPFLGGCCAGEDAVATEPPATLSSPAPETVRLRYVTWKLQQAKDFRRISEYFGGEENTGGDTIVRTRRDNRDGLYFILALEWSTRLPKGAVAKIELVTTGGSEPKKFSLLIPPVDRPAHLREIKLGVTGEDWPENQKIRPVAWKITLRDPVSLEVIGSAQSYLWSLDAPKR